MSTAMPQQNKTLNAAEIGRLIPHSGSMCLLAEVLDYDQNRIICKGVSHSLRANPLLESGVLHAVCGIEYAAQAMAVHGALLAGEQQVHARGGRLASVRSVEFFVWRLDDIADDLHIEATQLMADANSMMYEFTVSALDRALLKGRATVVLVS
jgi:predicted hotdog family 3-hydroxylacyl-ACP dehydratase